MPAGRPRYQPTEADRNTVRSMAACGFPQTAIARCIGEHGVNPETLREHFRDELDTAMAKANAAVANKVYQMAIAGDPPAATFFWLKCRCGWREVEAIDHRFVDAQGKDRDSSPAEMLLSRINSLAARIAKGSTDPEPAA